jgi:hypothetical protein
MPGFNPAELNYRVLNGNAVVLLIGDQAVAFAQNVGMRFGYGTEGLYGVGSAKPQEIQQLRVAPEITVDELRLSSIGNTLLQTGQNLPSLLSNNQFNISVVDGTAQQVLLTFVGAVASDYSETVASNRPITDAITFMAMDVLDSSGQSVLDGPNAFNVPGVAGIAVNGGLGIKVSGSISGGLNIGGIGALGAGVSISI